MLTWKFVIIGKLAIVNIFAIKQYKHILGPFFLKFVLVSDERKGNIINQNMRFIYSLPQLICNQGLVKNMTLKRPRMTERNYDIVLLFVIKLTCHKRQKRPLMKGSGHAISTHSRSASVQGIANKIERKRE